MRLNKHPDSSKLVRLAEEKSQNARKRVLEAIQALSHSGKPINFSAVSKAAGVSKTFLYDPKHADLSQQIRRLREMPLHKAPASAPTGKSESAKDAQLARLKERIAALERERQELQKENEILWGRLALQQKT